MPFFCYTSDHLEMVVLPLPAKKNETIRNFTSPIFISLQRIRRLVFFSHAMKTTGKLTASLHLKNDAWKISLSLWDGLFSGDTLILGSVCDW